jgi:hypothetical protein
MIHGQAESAIPSPEPLGRSACERKEGAASPETASCTRKEASRQPILKPSKRDDQILIANCVHARAKSVAAVNIPAVPLMSTLPPKADIAERNQDVR